MADRAAQRRVRVVAAAVFDPGAGADAGAAAGAGRHVLIAQRPSGKHMAGRWEFPGGKVATGESDLEALRRELHEELGIEVAAARHCLTLTHAYSDRTVELSMWIVDRYRGEPRALDGQQIKWVAVGALGAEDILEADRPFIEALQAGGFGAVLIQ
ncbi:MAG: 8-oxo-dGTP diphosphatase MutT [Steroidobacteraceae bacterium]